MSIHVTRSLVPPREALETRLHRILESRSFTNGGAQVEEFEARLRQALAVPHALAVANGTLALQLAARAFDLEGEVLTTPLSFVATTSALQWIGLEPVFGDVDPARFTLDPASCEARIGPRTSAILATHVFGLPCDVEGLAALAERHGLRLIYDASHAFGCTLGDRPLAAYGDAATLSFHATKILHTGEGGAICTASESVAGRVRRQRNFGFDRLAPISEPGINAKLSELHAAVGLCVLPLVDPAIRARRARFEAYCEELGGLGERLRLPDLPPDFGYNYAYFPVVLSDEESVVRVWSALVEIDVYPRRYFHPALSTLATVTGPPAPVAEDLCPRLLCLPLYDSLPLADVARIAERVRKTLA